VATVVNPFRLQLGRQLNKHRGAANMTAKAIEEDPRLRWARGKWSKVIAGLAIPNHAEVYHLAEIFGLGTDQRDELVRLADTARKKVAQPHTAEFAKSAVVLEQAAERIDHYGEELIPAIVAVEAYSRTLIETNPSADVESWVRDRVARADLLDRPEAPAIRIVLSESALRRIPASCAADQLRRLQHPAVDLRILPFRLGLHRAVGVRFTILYLAADIRCAYTEGLTEANYLHDEETDVYAAVFQDIWDAVTPAESETILRGHILETEGREHGRVDRRAEE
jgi:uncharacterized protein DUF5753